MNQFECPEHGPVKPGQIVYDGHKCSRCSRPLRVAPEPDWRDRRIAHLEAELKEAGRQLASMRGF